MVNTPASVARPSITEANQDFPLLSPLASMTDVTVNPSGILCKKTARKMIKPRRNQKPRGNGDTVEKGMTHQADKHRHPLMRMNKLIRMRFFAIVKMGRDGV